MKTLPHTFVVLSALLALTACQSPVAESGSGDNGPGIRETSQLMPPAPPADPETEAEPAATPEPIPEPPPELPEGISLEVDGKPVTLDVLRAGGHEEDTTVIVRVTPETRYESVVEVLDKIHGMGFLIALKTGE